MRDVMHVNDHGNRIGGRSGDRMVAGIAAMLAIIVLFLAWPGAAASAQTMNPHAGRKFIVAFPDTMRDDVPPILAQLPGIAQIIIFSDASAHVAISRQGGIPINVTVTPSSSRTVQLDEFGIYLDSGLARAGTWTVQADTDIFLYCYFATPDGSEAFTPLPVDRWGTSYYAVTTRGDQVGHRIGDTLEEKLGYVPAPPEIIAIASENQTTVRFHGLQDGSFPRDVIVMLDAGEAYTLESLPRTFSTSFENLAGTLVTADKPIGVMSGNTRSSGAGTLGSHVLTGNTLKNTLIEWMTPVEMHGTTFSTSLERSDPGGANEDPEHVITVAGASGVTDVQQGYPPVPTPANDVQLTPGEWQPWQMAIYEDPPGSNAYDYRSSSPAQSFVIPGAVDDTVGHEDHRTWPTAMAELPPYERWGISGRFIAPAVPTFLSNRVMIVADTNAVVLLDGTPIVLSDPDLLFTRFRHATLPVTAGDHVLEATTGKFAAVAFGAAPGIERYRPAKAEKEGPSFQHITIYTELAGYAYAYPVSTRMDTTVDRTHDLLFASTENCDSSVVVVSSVGGPGTMPTVVVTAADSTGIALRIDTVMAGGEIGSLRVVMTPEDRSVDGHMVLTISDGNGKQRTFIFEYHAARLVSTPDPVSLTDVPAGVLTPISITLTNPNGYPVRITSGRLAEGTHGFQINAPSPFPVEIPPGGSVTVDLRFIRADYDQLFTDALILQLDCRQDTIPLSAMTEPEPAVHLSGHSWSDRWITTLNSCTRSGIASYDSLIWVENPGGTDFTVVAFDLVGADADDGYFLFDVSDPSTVIGPGDVIPHGDATARHYQRVLFRPKEERIYSCRVRLIVSSGAGLDTVWSMLDGGGIESHLDVSDYTFPALDFSTEAGTEVAGTVDVTAHPTRPLTIRALTIVGAMAGAYRVDQADLDLLPRTLAPGDVWHVGIWHRLLAPGKDSAVLVAVSDGSQCDDSTGMLRGESYLAAADVQDTALGTILPCAVTSLPVRFRNGGTVPLTISAISAEPDDLFDLAHDQLPIVVPPGGEITVLATLKRTLGGIFNGRILFTVDELDDMVTASISGSIDVPVLIASIDRSYRALPGNDVSMPVSIDGPLGSVDGAAISAMRFDISYHVGILLPEYFGDPSSLLVGTLLEGWNCTVEKNVPGRFVVRVERNGHPPLKTAGTMLDLRFRTFLGDTLESEIVPVVTIIDGACIPILPNPGHVRLDSVCGLSYRMIEMVGGKTALGAPHPNPAGSSVEIPFSLAFDGPVRLALLDATGRVAAVPVDGRLAAGSYTVDLPLDDLPAGLYFCRLETAGIAAVKPLLHLH